MDKLYITAFITNSMNKTSEAVDIFENLINEKFGGPIYMKVEGEYFEKNRHEPLRTNAGKNRLITAA